MHHACQLNFDILLFKQFCVRVSYPLSVIASEAKQSIKRRRFMDCFVASLLAKTKSVTDLTAGSAG
jgi:hypothetical protein